MIDLAYVSSEQKDKVIRGDAEYQLIYVLHQPNSLDRINDELIEKMSIMYNGSIDHSRILDMYAPLSVIIQEKDIDKVSVDLVAPIIKNLIDSDYGMFLDLMAILATMLEVKDNEMKCNYIDSVVECSDQIVALASAAKEEEEEECGNGPATDNDEPCDPQMSPDE